MEYNVTENKAELSALTVTSVVSTVDIDSRPQVAFGSVRRFYVFVRLFFCLEVLDY